ncbi:hypothetical protein Tco_0527701 [Tanacetum coccineum]
MYYPRFTKVIIHHFLIQDKTLSWRNKIGMHTSKDDYLINTLRFVSRKEASQIYGAVLPDCLTSPEMKESKAYKKDSVPVQVDEEPVQKGKRVKRSAKKSSTTPTAGIVIRETIVKTKSTGREKVDVTRGKGIELLSETHPSGSGTVAEKPPSVDKITPTVISERTGGKPGVPNVIEDDSTESESESWGNDEDDSNNDQDLSNEDSEQEHESKEQVSDSEQKDESDDDDQEEEEFVHTPSPTDDKDDDNLESESDDVIKSDEEKGMDDTKEVVQDAHVTIFTVTKKTEVPITSSSLSSDLASKFLNFSDIPQADAEIVSPLDVHVHHEVPRTEAPTLFSVPVSVIPESSSVFTNIPQSSHIFTPTPIQATHTPPSTIETINPLSTLPDFSSVFRFNDRITTLEKEVDELKKDPLHTKVTSLVDTRIKEQVRDQLPQILPKEVSNFAPPMIEKMIEESRNEVTLAKVFYQPHSSYEAAATLTEFELKKILIDKMEKSESYLTATQHRDCYDGLKKSYKLDMDYFSSYDVYSLKRSRKDKDKDEDPSTGSDRGLKKRNTSKDAEPTTGQKKKDSTAGSSKGTKSQSRYSRKSIQSEEPVFEVTNSDMPQDHEGNLGDNEDEPRNETASRRDWFKKPTPPQEPTDSDWNIGKTTQEGPTQNWLMTLVASTSTDNLLLKGTRSNYVELEYDFEECYKALSEKLDWENPEGGDYPFDLSKPLPLIKHGKRQRVPFEFFINNDLKYLQGGILTMTYTTSTTKTKAAKYDLPGIEDIVPNIWSLVKVMRKHGYGYVEEIIVGRADNVLYRFKEGDDVADFAIALRMFTRSLVIHKRVEYLQLGVKSYQKKINVTKPGNTRPDLRKRHPYTPYKDPQGFIYVDDFERNRLMRSEKLYKFSDGMLTRLLSSLEDITKNINMEYFPKRRWSTLEKKRAHFMIKDINKLLKERRMIRSLEKFIGGRLYETDLRLLQRTI